MLPPPPHPPAERNGGSPLPNIAQVFAIAVRLVMLDLTPGMLLVALLLQTLVEILTRFTVMHRDNALWSMAARIRQAFRRVCRCCNRSSIQPDRRPNTLGNAAATAAAAAVIKSPDYAEWRREHAYSLILISDQIAEYVAILVVHAQIVVFFPAMHTRPMAWYAALERPFDRALPLGPVAASLAVHLGAEIVSDFTCCYLEERLAVPLQCTLRSVRKWALFVITTLTAIHAVGKTWWYIGGYYNECYGTDACYCVGKKTWGMQVVTRYCKEWLYPDTAGVPPSPTPTATRSVVEM